MREATIFQPIFAKKKLAFSFILCIVLILCLSLYSFAEDAKSGSCGESAFYSLDDKGVLTIIGTGGMEDYALGESPWLG